MFFKGILNEQGFLAGSPSTENTRFGMAISAVPDLDLDGYSDVIVGAPLEGNQKGAIYIYNGEKQTLKKQFSQVTNRSDSHSTFIPSRSTIVMDELWFQKILGSSLDPQLQYFGRSLDAHTDLNDDTIPDISVGAYGKVVQLW